MKIALLNLPFDSNFGGNLQRYALITILQRNGYNVEHINLRFNYKLPWYKKPFSYSKRIIKKLIYHESKPIFLEQQMTRNAIRKNKATEIFYNKYIPHTSIINNKKELSLLPKYDAYIVGSDQVWRKSMTRAYGLSTYFFDFLKNDSSRKIAYGVSLGSDQNELTPTEIKELGYLYKQFSAVSVRETSSISLFQNYKWTSPQAIQVLDPTLLLSKEDYDKLIDEGNTHLSSGEVFCYILDKNIEKEKIILKISDQLKLKPFYINLEGNTSIEQWLRSFQDAKHVITDSFHGLVFSIIFNKPFTLIRNEKRGNARFDSLLKTFKISANEQDIDWKTINLRIQQEKEKAIAFLMQALKTTPLCK